MRLQDNTKISVQSGLSFLFQHLNAMLIKIMTRNSMNVYLRPNDTISTGPLISGVYEQHATDFFKRCAALGYFDFFLDVGANIGLTSYSAASLFDRLYAFEPNPLAFKLLEVNVSCSDYSDKFRLFNFGIGSEDGRLSLVVPKRNWGGAFLESDENSYGEDVLMEKDGFAERDSRNYVKMAVEVRQGAKVFKEIFSEVTLNGGKAGVIKIDVEGFELSVIRQIAQAIPQEISAYILFENWDSSVNPDEFTMPFKGRATLFRLAWKHGAFSRGGRILRRARFIAGLPFGLSKLVYKLEPISPSAGNVTGDIVMHISETLEGNSG